MVRKKKCPKLKKSQNNGIAQATDTVDLHPSKSLES